MALEEPLARQQEGGAIAGQRSERPGAFLDQQLVLEATGTGDVAQALHGVHGTNANGQPARRR